MKTIIVASQNPVKINATLAGFQKMLPDQDFQAEGLSVQSGVSDQPATDQETRQGAVNRVEAATQQRPEADFWVGIEGGINPNGSEMEAFAWVVIKSSVGQSGQSKTNTFFLPPQMVELIQQGLELGQADDQVFNQTNSKQKNGTIGNLTNNLIDRTNYYTEAVILALIPFKNPDLYSRQ